MTEVFFVVNQSYLGYTPSRVFSMLNLRKRIYRCLFLPMLHTLAFLLMAWQVLNLDFILKRMAYRLCTQGDRNYAEVLGCFCAQLAFGILRASVFLALTPNEGV